MRALATLLGVVLAAGVSAQATMRCYDRDQLRTGLASRYGEIRVAVGIDMGGNPVEIYASAETGTWTLVVLMPPDMACMLIGGGYFEILDEMALLDPQL